MARPLRIELGGGLYHVTSRGDRREAIYRDDADRSAWLELLGDVCERFNWRCHAYCQMTNHYHIVVETPEANLPQCQVLPFESPPKTRFQAPGSPFS